jgi:3-oxoacyl-[acyl-carrier protein] reductase/pteridine reductase
MVSDQIEKEKTQSNMRPLEGQAAIVTGAAKRMGRAIALQLAEAGASVAIHYRASAEEAKRTAAEVEQHGVRSFLHRADISRRQEARELVEAAARHFGRLDILVNNAGVFFEKQYDQLTGEDLDRILGVNLKAHLWTAQAAAPIMKSQGRGRIINITSIGGLLPWPAYMHYCASKAAAIMLTRCLARALGPEITVNSVAPGTIQFPGETPDQEYIRRSALKRTGKGEDIASTVLFLASDAAGFITGQVLIVDGGRTLA